VATQRNKPSEWADSAAAIVAARTMDVTLLSGLRVTLRTVTLEELAVAEALPADLYHTAVLDSADLLLPQMLRDLEAEKPEDAHRRSQNLLDLRDRVVKLALVKPEPSEKVLEALDGFDKALITELAQRKRSVDAAGKVVAAQSLADFDQFRDESDSDPDSAASGEDGKVADAVD